MKIITWNVAHQATTGNKKNLLHMAEALATLSPDIIVLTEYVPSDQDNKFSSDLKKQGYECKISKGLEPLEKKNQVLIASRRYMELETLTPPSDIYPDAPWNIIHVTIPELNLGILGLRMPVKMKAAQMKTWWDWVTVVAEKNQNHPFIILGDFNTDECSKGPNGGRRIIKLKEDGWYHALPAEGASYYSQRGGVISPFRIDHAFFSKHLTVLSSEYRTEYGPYRFAKTPDTLLNAGNKVKAMSDHAMLVVEFDLN